MGVFTRKKLVTAYLAFGFLAALTLAAGARAGVNNWTTTGPSNPNDNSVVVSPGFATDNTVFTGAWYGGGVFKSTDGGASWIEYGNGLSVDSLTVSPGFSSDKTVFAGLASGGVSKSTDGGASWNKVDSGLPADALGTDVYSMAASPSYATDNTVFTGAWYGGGVFKSTDGGASWNMYDNGLADNTWVDSLAVSPAYGSDHIIFAGVYPNVFNTGGVFKSSNGGASWSEYNNGLSDTTVDSLAVSPAYTGDHTVFAGTDSGVFKSSDGGSSWSSCGFPSSSVYALAVSPNFASDRTVFAGTQGGGVFESTDGGSNWIAVNGGLTNMTVNSLAISSAFASSSKVAFAATAGGVFSDTFPCSPCSSVKPDLTLSSPNSFWASLSNFDAGVLSVTWTLNNTGSNEAWSVQFTSSNNTNGVTLASTLPAGVNPGSILPGSSGSATLKYNVPVSVGSWVSTLKGSAQDGVGTTYTYP